MAYGYPPPSRASHERGTLTGAVRRRVRGRYMPLEVEHRDAVQRELMKGIGTSTAKRIGHAEVDEAPAPPQGWRRSPAAPAAAGT